MKGFGTHPQRIGILLKLLGGEATHKLLSKATGLKASIGEACRIFTDSGTSVATEVVGFKDGKVLLMADGELSGIRLGRVELGVSGIIAPLSVLWLVTRSPLRVG